jgi:hypothetical protein
MFRYIFSVCVLSVEISAMSFLSVVQENASDPAALVHQLQEIRETDDPNAILADAFLRNFGRDGYSPEVETKGQDDELVNSQVAEAALLVGSKMHKIGASGMRDINALLAARNFLGFAQQSAKGGSKGFAFFNEDVSPSFVIDQIDGMLDCRRAYIDRVTALKAQPHIEVGHDKLLDPSLLSDL